MNAPVLSQPWSILNEPKRSRSEEGSTGQVHRHKLKSKSDGGSGSASASTPVHNTKATPHKILSTRTVDLVQLLKSKDESPLSNNISSSPTLYSSSPLYSTNSSGLQEELSELNPKLRGVSSQSDKFEANTIIGDGLNRRHSENGSFTKYLFKRKYILAPTVIEDYSLACESRDSEEESRIAAIKLKAAQVASSGNGKSTESFHLQEQATLKIYFVGDREVGKSSILRRYLDNSFDGSYTRTDGVDFKPDIFRQRDGSLVKCQLWDTAGGPAESHHVITRAYFKSAHVFALVFSISDRSSFNRLSYWLDNIRMFGQKDVEVVIVGNKSDVDAVNPINEKSSPRRAVSHVEASHFARSQQLQYLESSACNGANINELVQLLMTTAALRLSSLNLLPPLASPINTTGAADSPALSPAGPQPLQPVSPVGSDLQDFTFSDSEMGDHEAFSGSESPEDGSECWRDVDEAEMEAEMLMLMMADSAGGGRVGSGERQKEEEDEVQEEEGEGEEEAQGREGREAKTEGEEGRGAMNESNTTLGTLLNADEVTRCDEKAQSSHRSSSDREIRSESEKRGSNSSRPDRGVPAVRGIGCSRGCWIS